MEMSESGKHRVRVEMHGDSCGEDYVINEENPSGDPAGWHPKLPWLPWDCHKIFRTWAGKKTNCFLFVHKRSQSSWFQQPLPCSLASSHSRQAFPCLLWEHSGRDSRTCSPQDCQGQGNPQHGAQKKRGQPWPPFSIYKETKGQGSSSSLALTDLPSSNSVFSSDHWIWPC